MKIPTALLRISALASCLAAMATATPVGAAEVADYQFNDSFNSSVPGATAIAPFAGGDGAFATRSVYGQNDRVWVFGAADGLVLETAGLLQSGDYSVVMYLQLDAVVAFTKLLDFQQRQSDHGLYVHGGEFDLFPFVDSAAPSVSPGVLHQLVITRSASGQVVGYVDALPLFQWSDGDLSAAAINGPLHVLVDDLETEDEEGSGFLARLRVFDHVLTPEEVRALLPSDDLFKDGFETR
jgi:hypothetical protein